MEREATDKGDYCILNEMLHCTGIALSFHCLPSFFLQGLFLNSWTVPLNWPLGRGSSQCFQTKGTFRNSYDKERNNRLLLIQGSGQEEGKSGWGLSY